MTSEKLKIIQHSLGVDQYGQGNRYRSHFVASAGHSDYETCLSLTEDGLMTHHKSAIVGGGEIFHVTQRGEQWMAKNSPPAPVLTRSQKRYRQYLNSECGESFINWLKQRHEPA